MWEAAPTGMMHPTFCPDLKGRRSGQDTGTSTTVCGITRNTRRYSPTVAAGVLIPTDRDRADDPESLLIDEGSGAATHSLKWAVLQASPGVPMATAPATFPANLDARFVRIGRLPGTIRTLLEISAEIDAVASVIVKQPFMKPGSKRRDHTFYDATWFQSNADRLVCPALGGSAGMNHRRETARAGTRLSSSCTRTA